MAERQRLNPASDGKGRKEGHATRAGEAMQGKSRDGGAHRAHPRHARVHPLLHRRRRGRRRTPKPLRGARRARRRRHAHRWSPKVHLSHLLRRRSPWRRAGRWPGATGERTANGRRSCHRSRRSRGGGAWGNAHWRTGRRAAVLLGRRIGPRRRSRRRPGRRHACNARETRQGGCNDEQNVAQTTKRGTPR